MGRSSFPVVRSRSLLKPQGTGALVLVLLYLTLFFFVPYGILLYTGLFGSGESPGFPLAEILRSPYYRRIIAFTFYQALLSTLFSLLLGIPGAYFMARYSFPGKKLIKALCTVPFVLPSILVVLGFVLFFGNSGYLNRALMLLFSLEEPPLRILYSLRAIVLAHTFYNFPICLRLVSSAWEREPESLLQAGRLLGANRFQLFRSVTLPYLVPSLSASALLTFLYCFNSFAIILVLGGGPKFTTVEVEIYRLARMDLNFSLAGGLSVLATLVSLGFTLPYLRYLNKSSGRISSETTGKRFSEYTGGSWVVKPLLVLYLLTVVMVILAPLVSVIIRSLLASSSWDKGSGFTFRAYRDLFFTKNISLGLILPSLLNSLIVASITCLIAGFFGTLSGYWSARKGGYPFLLPLSLLPLGVSSLVLGLGYSRLILLHSYGNPFLLLGVIHSILSFPFISQGVAGAARSITPSLRKAAATLGASPGYAFRTLEIPLLLPSLISGLSFAFAISLGEFQGALLILSGRASTIPITLYRLIGAYNFNGACALGTILILLCTVAFFIIQKTEGREE